jgi:hypothetical protein
MNKNKEHLSMDELLTIPVETQKEIKPAETWEDENWFIENILENDLPLDDNINSPIKGLVKFPEDLTVLEFDRKMSSIHNINSIKDLRADDHAGISIPITKVLKWFTDKKKKYS